MREALHALVARVQSGEALRRRWAELGVDQVMALPPAETERYFAVELERWEGLMRHYRAPQAAPR